MTGYRIAELPGDGVGSEVMEAAKLVLDQVGFKAEYIHGDIGWEFWKKEGNPLPDRTIELLKKSDCCLFSAITSKPKEEAQKELIPELQGKGLVYSSPIVKLRQLFDLYVNLRPCKAYPGNPLNFRDDLDLVVFRENTEGLYAGIEFENGSDDSQEMIRLIKKLKYGDLVESGISIKSISEKASERIARFAFEYALKNDRKKVTCVTKSNIMKHTDGLFQKDQGL